MENINLTTECFSSGKKNYFIDFKRAVNDSHYMCITRSDQLQNGSYHRSNVVVFEEDFHSLISAISSLLHSATYLHQDNLDIAGIRKLKQAKKGNGIKSWAPELRPREKFVLYGVEALGDAELLAMLIGSGSADLSAVALSANILKSVGGKLNLLATLDHLELSEFKGIGVAKSSSILAALELGRRMCAA